MPRLDFILFVLTAFYLLRIDSSVDIGMRTAYSLLYETGLPVKIACCVWMAWALTSRLCRLFYQESRKLLSACISVLLPSGIVLLHRQFADAPELADRFLALGLSVGVLVVIFWRFLFTTRFGQKADAVFSGSTGICFLSTGLNGVLANQLLQYRGHGYIALTGDLVSHDMRLANLLMSIYGLLWILRAAGGWKAFHSPIPPIQHPKMRWALCGVCLVFQMAWAVVPWQSLSDEKQKLSAGGWMQREFVAASYSLIAFLFVVQIVRSTWKGSFRPIMWLTAAFPVSLIYIFTAANGYFLARGGLAAVSGVFLCLLYTSGLSALLIWLFIRTDGNAGPRHDWLLWSLIPLVALMVVAAA